MSNIKEIPSALTILKNNHLIEGFNQCTYDISVDSMIQFAALHVEAALKAAAENAEI